MAEGTIENKYFGKGGRLNADDAAFSVGQEEWVNMENCRTGTTDKGFTGVVESIGSTEQISQPMPSIVFTEIGSVSDDENNRIVRFLFCNNAPFHKIVCFDKNTNFEYDVLLSSQVQYGLNFSKNSLIHSARIVNNMLYWVDSTNNQPRKININSAIKANYPDYSTIAVPYSFPIKFSEITIIKPTCIYPPTINKNYNSLYTNNFIATESFQFAFQYVYYDNETSVVGAYSNASKLNSKFDAYNYNYITVEMDGGEFVPSTVRIVNLIVRYGDTNNAAIIKTWDKTIPSEATEIANNNSGTQPLRFYFYNDKTGNFIAQDDVLKPFDDVPIYSKTLEVAKNRLFLANNTIGYDTPTTSSLSLSYGSSPVTGNFTPNVFPQKTWYHVGIVFYDFAMRKSGVVTNDSLAFYTGDRDYDYSEAIQHVNWSLSNSNALNEIPEWAYYYSIVMTRNTRTRFFIQSYTKGIRYVKKKSDGSYAYFTDFTDDVYAIGIAVTELLQSGLGYTYNEGDLCILVLSPSGNTYTLPIIGSGDEYVFLKPFNIGNGLGGMKCAYEYYTPYKASESEPFYEVGNMYFVKNPTTDMRQYSTTDGTLNGDSCIIKRSYVTTNLGFTTTIYYYSNAMSYNDLYYKVWDTDASKLNFVTKLGQVNKTQYISWSDTFFPNTTVNGLSTFRALNEKSVDENCGHIQKLQLTSKIQNEGTVMISICTNETNSMYLGETQIIDSTGGTQFFSASQNVISTINILRGSFGTVNPESVVFYRGSVFWLDAINGRYIQYSQNGLYPISNQKMTKFWKLFSQQYLSMTKEQIEALGSRPFVFSTVDSSHDELLITIPKLFSQPVYGYLPDYPSTIYPFDIWDGQAKTIVYKLGIDGTEVTPHWQGSYSFTPEGYSVLNNELYSSKNGLLHKHNSLNSQNNFYGTQYYSKVMFVSNKGGEIPKVYNNINIQSNIIPNFVYLYNNYPIQQSSDLLDIDFRLIEGIYYGRILRNKLVPTATGFTTDGLLTGEKMRNQAMYIMCQFAPTTQPLNLRFINVDFQISLGHKL